MGGGGGSRDFFRSEILAKTFFWVYGRHKDFLGRNKTGIFLGIVLFIKSTTYKCNLLLEWDLFGYVKKVGIFCADKF